MSDIRDKLRDRVSDKIVAAQIEARIALHKGEHEDALAALLPAAISAAQEQVIESLYENGLALVRIEDLERLRHQLRKVIGGDDDEALVLFHVEEFLVELIKDAKGFHE